jgi:hypothetical protein
LLSRGAGHVVLKVSQKHKIDLREAARRIVEDKALLENLF